MPYMIYQQYATAIKEAYAEDEAVAGMFTTAKECREWLASLKIDPQLRDPLVEQIAWIEEAFKDLLANTSKPDHS
jgi:hypothetical protein